MGKKNPYKLRWFNYKFIFYFFKKAKSQKSAFLTFSTDVGGKKIGCWEAQAIKISVRAKGQNSLQISLVLAFPPDASPL